MIKFLVTSILLVTLMGCGARGTGTGNPNRELNNGAIQDTATGRISSAVCNKLVGCNGPTVGLICLTSVLALNTYAEHLGWQNGGADVPLRNSELIELEVQGSLTPNFKAANSCVQSIQALSCDSPEVVKSYDPKLNEPFSNSAEMLNSNCLGVFSL